MIARNSNNSIWKRKEKLKHDLIEIYGLELKFYIDSELTSADSLFFSGLSYPEILSYLKSVLDQKIPQKNGSISSLSYSSPQKQFSTPVHINKLPTITSKNSNNFQKNLEDWHDYNERHQRFLNESLEIYSKKEKNTNFFNQKIENLEINSKIDEIKALEAYKLREEQGREVEARKKIERFINEREIRNIWGHQVQEKKRNNSEMWNENKTYAMQLEERKNFLKAIEDQEKFRKRIIQNNYSKALNEQILQKNLEKKILGELDDQSKQIFTPEFLTDGRPTPIDFSQSSERSESMMSMAKNHSPIKFLMQYGNYIMVNGKNKEKTNKH